MKKLLTNSLFGLCAVLMMSAVMFGGTAKPALAATPNYSGVPIVTMPVLIAGQRTAAASSVASLQVPAKMKLIGVSAKARAVSGVTDTFTLDVRAGSTSVLSSHVVISAAAVNEGTISTSTIPDETVLSLDLAASGVAPAVDDISVLLTLLPL